MIDSWWVVFFGGIVLNVFLVPKWAKAGHKREEIPPVHLLSFLVLFVSCLFVILIFVMYFGVGLGASDKNDKLGTFLFPSCFFLSLLLFWLRSFVISKKKVHFDESSVTNEIDQLGFEAKKLLDSSGILEERELNYGWSKDTKRVISVHVNSKKSIKVCFGNSFRKVLKKTKRSKIPRNVLWVFYKIILFHEIGHVLNKDHITRRVKKVCENLEKSTFFSLTLGFLFNLVKLTKDSVFDFLIIVIFFFLVCSVFFFFQKRFLFYFNEYLEVLADRRARLSLLKEEVGILLEPRNKLYFRRLMEMITFYDHYKKDKDHEIQKKNHFFGTYLTHLDFFKFGKLQEKITFLQFGKHTKEHPNKDKNAKASRMFFYQNTSNTTRIDLLVGHRKKYPEKYSRIEEIVFKFGAALSFLKKEDTEINKINWSFIAGIQIGLSFIFSIMYVGVIGPYFGTDPIINLFFGLMFFFISTPATFYLSTGLKSKKESNPVEEKWEVYKVRPYALGVILITVIFGIFILVFQTIFSQTTFYDMFYQLGMMILVSSMFGVFFPVGSLSPAEKKDVFKKMKDRSSPFGEHAGLAAAILVLSLGAISVFLQFHFGAPFILLLLTSLIFWILNHIFLATYKNIPQTVFPFDMSNTDYPLFKRKLLWRYFLFNLTKSGPIVGLLFHIIFTLIEFVSWSIFVCFIVFSLPFFNLENVLLFLFLVQFVILGLVLLLSNKPHKIAFIALIDFSKLKIISFLMSVNHNNFITELSKNKIEYGKDVTHGNSLFAPIGKNKAFYLSNYGFAFDQEFQGAIFDESFKTYFFYEKLFDFRFEKGAIRELGVACNLFKGLNLSPISEKQNAFLKEEIKNHLNSDGSISLWPFGPKSLINTSWILYLMHSIGFYNFEFADKTLDYVKTEVKRVIQNGAPKRLFEKEAWFEECVGSLQILQAVDDTITISTYCDQMLIHLSVTSGQRFGLSEYDISWLVCNSSKRNGIESLSQKLAAKIWFIINHNPNELSETLFDCISSCQMLGIGQESLLREISDFLSDKRNMWLNEFKQAFSNR